MVNENEFDFVPLAPMTHNSLPEEMKDFIASSGIMGMMPKRNFISPRQGIIGRVIDLKVVDESLEDEVIHEEFLTKECNRSSQEQKGVKYKFLDESVDESVEEVLKKIEVDNVGVLKFLQANGMPYDKAKKFVKRVVRLSINYMK